jgi:hypothetical protein
VKEVPRLFSRTGKLMNNNNNSGGSVQEGIQWQTQLINNDLSLDPKGGSASGGKYQGSSYTSDPSLPRNKKSTRWVLIKQVCAVVALLLFLLPLFIFLCMLLPDEFTEITHYAIQHYEAEKVGSSQGPVLNFQLSKELILKVVNIYI